MINKVEMHITLASGALQLGNGYIKTSTQKDRCQTLQEGVLRAKNVFANEGLSDLGREIIRCEEVVDAPTDIPRPRE